MEKLYDVPKISSIQEMIIGSAKTYSDKIALEDLNKTPISNVTYNELLDYIYSFGKGLQKLGIEERAHIALISENRVQWVISYLTAMVFNFVIVPIDRNLSSNEIYNIVHESDAQAIIFSESFGEIFSGSNTSLKNLKHFICMDDSCADSNFNYMMDVIDYNKFNPNDIPSINPNDVAEIVFTSGSLGRAKGVMLSQKNLATNLSDMVSMLFIYPTDKFLSVLPIHHTYECTCGMLCPLYAGASAHYARGLKTIVDDLQKVKATMLLGVPLLFDKMFKRVMKGIEEDKVKAKVVPALMKLTNITSKLGLKKLKGKLFSELHEKFGGHVRLFIAGGAAPDPLVAKGLREFGFGFLQGYGLTETSPILALNRVNKFKDDAAGVPLPSVTLMINNKDEDGIGEVYAKGDNVMLGYYKNEKATAETFEDGWFKTGDYGFIDKDGFLHITGRKKNVIISKSGKNVFPEEIEDMLNRSPFILEAVVFGEDDAKQDEIIAAQIVPDAETFIKLSEETNVRIEESLIREKISEEVDRINKELSSYKRVRKFYIREEEFEKTTTQKIKRYLVSKPV